MATSSEKEIINTLRIDVAELKVFNEKVVEPALNDIQEALRNLAYVPIKEFTDYQAEVDKRFSNLQKKSFKENTLAALFGSVITGISLYIANGLIK